MAAASSGMSTAPATELHAVSCLPPCATLQPKPYLDHRPNHSLLPSSTCDSDTSFFPQPPDLFSSHDSHQEFTLPHTQKPGRSYFDENTSVYDPFRKRASHSSTLTDLRGNRHQKSLASNTLPTVASEPTLLTHSDTSCIVPHGTHLPHSSNSPDTCVDSSASPFFQPSHGIVLTHGPAPSSSLLPIPPPPPCPTGPGEGAAWGCCCSLSGAVTPISCYLGKVGHGTLPLLKLGGLLNAEPSDVQT